MKRIQLNIVTATVSIGFVCLQTAEGSHFDSLPEVGNPGWNYQYETAMDSTSDSHGTGGSTSDSNVAGGFFNLNATDLVDYRTSTDLDTTAQVKIRGDMEWVLRVDVEVTTHPSSGVMRIVGIGDEDASPAPKDGDLFELEARAGAGNMRVFHGGGNYDFNVSTGMVHVYEFHFTPSHVIDLYVDDILETAGLTALANPNVDHQLSSVRYANKGTGTFSVDRLQAANFFSINVTSAVDVALFSLAGQQFDTCGDNDVYILQSTMTPPTGPWMDTGAHTPGEYVDPVKILFDPAGPDGALTYRVQRLANSAIPDPALNSNQTGVSVPFDVDLNGVDWGLLQGVTGDWIVSNGIASITVSNSDLRLIYQPTMFNDTSNPSNLFEDGWVVAYKFKYNSADLHTMGGVEGGTSSSNKYEIQFPGPGVNGGSLFSVDIVGISGIEAGPFTIPMNTYISIVIHYKGTNNLIDIYFNGLRVQDFDLATHPTVSGPFLVNQIQLAGGGPSTSELEIRGLFAGPVQTSDTTIASTTELKDTIAVSMATETGKIYQLQQANDLVTEEFELIGTRVTGNGGTQQLYDVITSQSTRSFLRAVELP